MSNRNATSTPDFDPLARIYRWMEYLSFGPMLERCRFHFLSDCANARHALVLGDGDGRFTARLLATNRSVQVDAIDASVAMLAQLEQRARKAASDSATRLHIICADLRSFTPPGNGYDLVLSHFFLDCLTEDEVAGLVQRTVPHLTSDVTWVISEFAIPEKGWQRTAARELVRFLYLAFNRLTQLQVRTIPDYAKFLSQHGFLRLRGTQFLCGLLIAEIWKREG